MNHEAKNKETVQLYFSSLANGDLALLGSL